MDDAGQPTPSDQQLQAQPQQVLMLNQESLMDYARFRENLLRHLNEVSKDDNDPNSVLICYNQRRDEIQERRKKNNEAAKRSRDSRRAKEDEIAIRAAFLEQENLQLKWEAARLKSETSRLKLLLSSTDLK